MLVNNPQENPPPPHPPPKVLRLPTKLGCAEQAVVQDIQSACASVAVHRRRRLLRYAAALKAGRQPRVGRPILAGHRRVHGRLAAAARRGRRRLRAGRRRWSGRRRQLADSGLLAEGRVPERRRHNREGRREGLPERRSAACRRRRAKCPRLARRPGRPATCTATPRLCCIDLSMRGFLRAGVHLDEAFGEQTHHWECKAACAL